MSVFNWVRSIFLAIGIAGVVGATIMVWKTQKDMSEGVKVQAVIRGHETHRSNGSTMHSPVFGFTTPDGEPIVVRSSYSTSNPSYEKGDQVEAFHPVDKPRQAQLISFTSLWMGPSILGGISSVFFIIGAGMFLVPWLRNRKAASLKQSGQPLNAKVVDLVVNTGVSINDAHPWQIVASWNNPATGEARKFHSANLWEKPDPLPEHVTVYVDEKNGKRYHVDV